ncbi:MAG: hypothetical protein K8L97_14245 [Anaerolineae bacterium]|nr:hypothetical protein [Anaerolineae bacterium]
MTALNDQLADIRPTVRTRMTGRPLGSLRFDLAAALLTAWFIGGLFLDGWAHNNGMVDNTFFTPWHLVLYSGYAAVGALITVTHFRNVWRGYGWTQALPQGYGLGLLGVALFGIGGGFDFWWHETFGFEANTEALLSPAHLLLATGAMLFITAPLRAGWNRTGKAEGWRNLLPTVLALLYILSMLTFFTQYSHFNSSPGVLVQRPSGNRFMVDAYAVWSLVIPATLFTGIALFALRRWHLPTGTFTLLLTVNTTLMWLMSWGRTSDYPFLLLVGPVTGLIADGIVWWLKPSKEQVFGIRVFASVVPFMMTLVYLFILNSEKWGGVWWPIHMWLGVPFVAGIAGLFLSYLAVPPAIPVEAQ